MHVAGLGFALMWLGDYVAQAIANSSEEDEGEKLAPFPQEDLSMVVPDYFKHSSGLIPVGVDSAGVLTYLNPQRFNSTEPLWQFFAKMKDGDYDAAFTGWAETVYSGGFVEQALRLAFTQNQLSKDREYYLAERYADAAIRDVSSMFIPGSYRRLVDKPARQERKGDPMTGTEYLAEQLGWTVHKIDLKDATRGILRNWAALNTNYRASVKGTGKNDYNPLDNLLKPEVTQELANKTYAEWYALNMENFQNTHERLNAVRNGLSNAQIAELASEAGVSKDNIRSLLSGKFTPPKLVTDGSKRDWFAEEKRKAVEDAGSNKEGQQKAREKWDNIKRMFLEAEKQFLTQRRNNDGS